MQLFGSERVFQDHGHEQLGRKEGQTRKQQVSTISNGVAQLHAAVSGKADDVARISFIHRFAALAQEGDHAGGAKLFTRTLHFEFHARGVFARGHAHEGNAVAVRGVHVGLHFEHHACKGGVFGLHFFDDRLFVHHE